MSAELIRYAVLGPIRAWRGDKELDLEGPKQRAVLAALLLSANRVVPASAIVDGVWGEHAPTAAAHLVHTYVSRLRRVLEPGGGSRGPGRVLARSGSGYVLRLEPGQLDLDQFTARLRQARACRQAGDLAGAVDALTAALAALAGPPLAGVPGPLADSERTRLAELHWAAVEDRAGALLELGRHNELTGDLAALAAEHPLRERIWALLMTALYRAGRQAEALAAYDRARKLLAEELGIDPGPELQRLQQQILTRDAGLIAARRAGGGEGTVVPRQLPAGSAHFVGRSAELSQLNASLAATCRSGGAVVICAIDGIAGIGKTTLAVHWAHQVTDQFPGGQLYVNLRGFDPGRMPTEPAEALRGFLEALGLPPDRFPRDLDARAALYRTMLAGRQVLVVLDNARDATQVRPLLPGSARCLVVVTSRYRLTSLFTHEGAHQLALDRLNAQESRALLAERLGAGRVIAEPDAAAELIESCEGLPLALAIAAARAASHPGFPLAGLAAELRREPTRLDALDGGEPQASLRAMLSWSVDALSPPVAAVFGLLGLAPGPDISLPAAASMIAQPAGRALVMLRELENAHLLTEHTLGRYRMHDLVRLYAAEHAERAHPQPSCQAALRRLTGFYTHTAHGGDLLLAPHRPPLTGLIDAVPGCQPQPLTELKQAQEWFASEHACLLAAQKLAASQGWDHVVWQLAWGLTTFHRRQGRLYDQVATWRAGLDAARNSGDRAAQMQAHTYFGEACALAERHEEALHHFRQGLALAEDYGDLRSQAHAHSALTELWEHQGDDQRALAHATHALALYQDLDDPVMQARMGGDVGWYHARLGNYEQARDHCHAALILHRRHRDREAVAATLDSLGYIAHHAGHPAQALRYYREALDIFRGLGDTYREAEILSCLAQAHAALGERSQARDAWRQALELYESQQRPADAERIRHHLSS